MKFLLPVLLSCLLIACGAPSPAESPSFPEGRATIGPHDFSVELATSPAQQEYGLMFRESLAEGHGMLFIFSSPLEITMWMKNTLIPLDMVFISPGKTILRIAENTTPQSIKIIPSGGPAIAVMEIPGGESARLGLAAGMPVSWTTSLPPAAN